MENPKTSLGERKRFQPSSNKRHWFLPPRRPLASIPPLPALGRELAWKPEKNQKSHKNSELKSPNKTSR